mmetsp:Transcript_30516/g.84185  ORF Transcript_30516/g.84185 Transcript_30516/m.84185 type:complete len:227 (-) Transcript_30516:1017-1697(-)
MSSSLTNDGLVKPPLPGLWRRCSSGESSSNASLAIEAMDKTPPSPMDCRRCNATSSMRASPASDAIESALSLQLRCHRSEKALTAGDAVDATGGCTAGSVLQDSPLRLCRRMRWSTVLSPASWKSSQCTPSTQVHCAVISEACSARSSSPWASAAAAASLGLAGTKQRRNGLQLPDTSGASISARRQPLAGVTASPVDAASRSSQSARRSAATSRPNSSSSPPPAT